MDGQPAEAVAKPTLAPLPALEPAVAPAAADGAPAVGTHQGAAALSIMLPTADPSQSFVNAEHWADVEKAWQAIIDHEVLCGMITEGPLGLEDAGIATFSPADFQQSTVGTSSYTCGANAFWAFPFSPPHRACRSTALGCQPQQRNATTRAKSLATALASQLRNAKCAKLCLNLSGCGCCD